MNAGEAAEEEQQQMELRDLQSEAICAEGVCPILHGQRRAQSRPEFQHVASIIRSDTVALQQ